VDSVYLGHWSWDRQNLRTKYHKKIAIKGNKFLCVLKEIIKQNSKIMDFVIISYVSVQIIIYFPSATALNGGRINLYKQ
jgi:hypothetical protein